MAGRHRHALVAVLAGAASACAVAAPGGVAAAAQVSQQPQPAEARTFATSPAGWTTSTSFGGLICIVGVTCPTGDGTYEPTDGTGGAGDGHLRASFGTLLGVLSTTTVSWTSPTFVAPADTDVARLTVAVRPDVASLLAVGDVELGAALIDVADGTRSVELAPVSIAAASTTFDPVSFDVPAGAVVDGRTYRIALRPSATTTVSAVTAGDVDLDDATLTLTDLVAPTSAPPTVRGAATSRTRTVDFDLGTDVTTATVQVLAGGRVLASSADGDDDGRVTLTLPDADGAYDVRVVRENEAGETSTSATVGVVLDRAAPDAGGAPRVSGPMDAATVAFDRAPDAATATIVVTAPDGTVLGMTPVPAGSSSATVDFPDAAGTYLVRVVQTDAAGNAATSPSTSVLRETDGTGGSGRTPGGGGGDTGGGTGGGSGGGTGGGGSGGSGGPGSGGSGGGNGGGSSNLVTDPGSFGALLGRCFKGGDVVVTDVVAARGARVKVTGLTRYAAQTAIRIVDLRGRTVGTARSDARGRFTGIARAPARAAQRQRSGYRAVIGTVRSPVVRLRRANMLRKASTARGVVTLRGQVDLRRAGRVRRILALGGRGAEGCASPQRLRAVGRVRLNRRTGAYTLRVRAPRGSGRIVVRTQVVGSRLASRSSYAVR